MAYSDEVLADSPLLYWRLDETAGSTAADSSGNGRNGTHQGAVSLNQPGLLVESNAAAVHTTSTYTNIADAAWMDVSAITVELWVKPTGAGDGTNGEAFASRYTSGGGFNWLVWRNQTNKIAVQFRNASGTAYNIATSWNLTTSTTYHVVFVYEPGVSGRLYVDGTLEASVAVSGNLQGGSSLIELNRYSQAGTTTGAGTFDEFAIYGTALTETRVDAHYEAGTTAAPVTGSASLVGAATLSASGSVVDGTKYGTASMTGSASLAASGVRKVIGSAAIAGAASLSTSGTRKAFGSASLTGSASLVAAGTVDGAILGSAAIVGAASMSATGVRTAYGSATIAGSLALVATGTRKVTGVASLVGTLTLTATGTIRITTVTPAERTYVVPAESRTYVVPAESRTLIA